MSRPSTAQTRKKRPLDRQLPKRMEDYIPESKLYAQLVELEHKLDSSITKKKLDLQEALAKPMKIKRNLRIFVSNTASDQYTTTKNIEDNSAYNTNFDGTPSWTLRIEGKLLDVVNPPNTRKSAAMQGKFSNFIKSIHVELQRDSNVYPEGNIIEWHKNASSAECDGVEIKRIGDVDCNVKILITLDNAPEKFKVSPELGRLLDIHTDTKPNIIMALWQYIKTNKLQDQEDKRVVTCDESLLKIFGLPRFGFPQVPDILNTQLLPADPIVIDYIIRVEKEFNVGQYAYDIEVEMNDPLRNKLQGFVSGNPALNKEISNHDEKISAVIQAIHQSKLKRDFMVAFSVDPVNFLKKFIASQNADMEIILGDLKIYKEDARRSEFYKGEWVDQGILHYLNSR